MKYTDVATFLKQANTPGATPGNEGGLMTCTEATKEDYMLRYTEFCKRAGWMTDEESFVPDEDEQEKINAAVAAYKDSDDWLSEKDRMRNLLVDRAAYETGDPEDTVLWLRLKDKLDPKFDMNDALGGHDYCYDRETGEVFLQ